MDYHDEATDNKAEVVVRLYKDQPYMEWNVQIGSVKTTNQGVEITTNFLAFDIDNENTFYTDSNGLEM